MPSRKRKNDSSYTNQTDIEKVWKEKSSSIKMALIKEFAFVDASSIKGKSGKKRPDKNTKDYNKTEMYEQKNDTESESGGYGSPSKGSYSANSTGYKTFGTGG